MACILVVDDDPYIRELVSVLLTGGGFSVREAGNGREALVSLGGGGIDLCVLDLMMPEMDGFEFTRHARKYHPGLPILMLTARGDISQKVKGFELGADDYLTKPFEGMELIMRVRALLRRSRAQDAKELRIGRLALDVDGRLVLDGEERVDIPMKEFELLCKLASTPGKTFPRDQLIEDVWGYDFEGNERTLDVHIGRLRERYPAEAYGFKITTIRGLGYRLEVIA